MNIKIYFYWYLNKVNIKFRIIIKINYTDVNIILNFHKF